MAVSEVYMDIPAVRTVSKTFGTISDTLKTVGKTLEMLSTTLKVAAFVGLVGGAAVAHFIDMIKPDINRIATKCSELDHDLTASIDAYQRGDEQGATRFY